MRREKKNDLLRWLFGGRVDISVIHELISSGYNPEKDIYAENFVILVS
jgi:hypothetical protein